MSDYRSIKVTADVHESVMRYKLNLAAEVGRNISIAETVQILLDLGNRHKSEVIKLARAREIK